MSRPRRRREQGHPAKIAARRERERTQDQKRSLPKSPAAGFCSAATRVEGLVEAEYFVSEMLAMLWKLPGRELNSDWESEIGGELLREIAAHGGTGAALILAGMRVLASTELAAQAGELADSLTAVGTSPPEWAAEIGSAEITRTAVMSEAVFDDGRTYFIEFVRADESCEALGIYVDHNLGGSVKDLLAAPSIDLVRETMEANQEEGPKLTLEEVDPGLLAARVRAAFYLTDHTLGAIVEEDYPSLRALALHRVRALPPAEGDPGFEEIPPEAREALLAEFLDAPESAGIEPRSEAAGVVESAIDYCADYVDGRPLRWSPVAVELFMASWLPRKVVAEDDFFAAVPDALAAWLRFAARKRDQPPEATAVTLAAISDYEGEMLDAVDDPSSAGPAAQLVAAMTDAGVDPTDEAALQTFLAGWNARSTLD